MIYHVISGASWKEQLHSEFLVVPSIQAEGFIHCCTKQQVEGVLARYFKGQSDLYLLEIDESRLICEVRFEKSTNDELFPHVYGPINKRAILSVTQLREE